jgi:hypothetical protein
MLIVEARAVCCMRLVRHRRPFEERLVDHTISSQTTAADTTVNSAFLGGIVPTTNYFGMPHYSSGLENFRRFLENWSGKTFTYNGSMVVTFPRQYATCFCVGPSASSYNQAPIRHWGFDKNFLDYNKLPPATPMVNKLVRGQWAVVAAN